MANNFAKLWAQKLLNRNAIRRAQAEIQNTGRALPCKVEAISGSILTVSFNVSPWILPKIKIPKAESPWIRMPTQIGDKGIVVPADQYIGSVSGLGNDLDSTPGNLSSLIFLPVSNAQSPPIDPDAAQIEGPNGAIIQTSDGAAKATVSPTGVKATFGSAVCDLSSSSSKVSFGAISVIVDASGVTVIAGGVPIKFTASGLNINGVDYLAHTHLYTPGSGTPTQTGAAQ